MKISTAIHTYITPDNTFQRVATEVLLVKWKATHMATYDVPTEIGKNHYSPIKLLTCSCLTSFLIPFNWKRVILNTDSRNCNQKVCFMNDNAHLLEKKNVNVKGFLFIPVLVLDWGY